MSAIATFGSKKFASQLHTFIAGFLVLTITPTYAQITLDGSLGPAGALAGPNYTIPSAVGQTRGSNLFHSFGLFNVQTGQSATFTGPNSISNIFGRVTGGQASTIDGTIRSQIPNANLYLMNPAGMVFGPNAFLDVRGSFHATTADYLKFADGAKFHADLSRQSTLTTAPVSAFGFLSQNPAAMDLVQNSLQVPDGKTLSIVGGDINIVGDPFFNSTSVPNLGARSGTIQLASVASPGEVSLDIRNTNLPAFERLGETNIFNAAYLYASGDGGGRIIIRGGRLLIDGSLVLANNLGSLDGAGPGVEIGMRGDTIIANSLITTDSFAGGRARDVQIAAESIRVDNSVIASSPFSAGNGGAVTISAAETITLAGIDTSINTINQPGSSGHAGAILLEAKNITIDGGAQVASATLGSGNGGAVQVTASETISLNGTSAAGSSGIFASSEPGGTGHAGAVVVEAKNLSITNGAVIRSGTFGSGNGGTVTVRVADTARFSGESSDGSVSSGIFGQANAGSTGAAGDISLEAGNVIVADGARISSATFGAGKGGTVRVTALDSISLDGSDSLITASSQQTSVGRAGEVFVTGKNVTLTGGAQIGSATFGSGTGGTVQVMANETLRLDGIDSNDTASAISANSEGSGNAGNVVVAARNVAVSGGAQIVSATFGSGNGGKVQVTANETISLDGAIITTGGAIASSGINASNQPGSTGAGGDVIVTASNLTVTNGAAIASGTFGSGKGGTVHVTANETITLSGFATAASGILTSAETGSSGNAGDIFVDTKNLTIAGGAQILGTTLGSGDGGTVRVTASESIQLDGVVNNSIPSGILVNAELGSSGNAGDIFVETKSLTITGGAQIASGTFGSGAGGTVQVTAADAIHIDGITSFASGIAASAAPGSTGPAGNIIVSAKNLTLTGGAQIASGTFGSGNGGTVQVTVSDTISVDGTATANGRLIRTAITAASDNGSTGDAGDIQISATNLFVTNGAAIGTGTAGPGHGGTVQVTASGTINLAGGGRMSSNSTNVGPGGNIAVRAREITLSDAALISATSIGTGTAGNIFIQGETFRSSNSAVTTQASSSDGGDIHLKVGTLVHLVNSQITTSVQGGLGQGGNIDIDPQFVVLNNSQISANAFGGPGGRVTIIADNFLSSPDSTITASSALSTPGTVDIQAPIADLSGSLAQLPEDIVQATSLLRQSCATRYSSGRIGSLASLSRSGMPFEPGGLLTSALPLSAESWSSQNRNEPALIASARPRFSIASECGRLY